MEERRGAGGSGRRRGEEAEKVVDRQKLGTGAWDGRYRMERVAVARQRPVDESGITDCVSYFVPLSPELKLLQLRQYLSGPPLKTVETYGYSAAAYAAALQRLDQKYGGEKRKTAVHMSALQEMPAIRERGTAKQLERFADLVQVAKINLIDAGRQNELSYGTFCTQLQQKLSQDLLTAYHRWRCDNNIVESVDSLLQWLVREADFRTEAEETLQSVSHSVAATRLMSKPAKSDISTAAALTVTSSSVECVFCGSGHESSQCSSITDIKRRKELIRKNGRCFICLKKNHMARDCKSRLRCSKCEHRHHTSICEPKSSEQPGTGAKTSPPSRQGGSGKWSKPVFSSTTAATVSDSGAVFLQTAQTSVVSPQRPYRKVPVRVMLDGGSQRSYATSSVLTQLDVRRSGQERVVINAFGGEQPSPSTLRDVVELDIQCVDGNRIRVNCIVVQSVCAPVQNQHTADVVTAYESLQNLSLADNCGGSASIDILLGADVYWQIFTGDIVRVDDGPTALDTRLGWVLSGPTGRCNSGIISTNVATVHACDVEPSTVQDPDSALVQLLQKFWQLESIGILPNEPDTLQLFQQTIRYDGQRYMVRLPWREDHRALPDNYSLSEKRLQSTLKKLQKSPEILKEYNAVIQEQLQKGIIEEVPTTEHDVVGEVHYLPHHPVIRQDKTTTKVRVVYDASAKVKTHPSLNDCIHTGPPLLEQITSILLRFRTHAVAFTADIEKAFLMVGIEAAGRDVLRFLWVDNPTSAQSPILIERYPSERAYAAAIYIVFTTEVGTSVQLVAAKTRVAPLKQQTIPRLELLSALVLARLMASVSSTLAELKIDQILCWSDSQVALAWIAGVEQTWKQFVESRVTEIRRLVPTSCWSYCPTASNPADLPSRGVKPSELTSTIWYTGPKWLHEPQPRAEVDSGSAASQCEEVERERKATPTTVMAVGAIQQSGAQPGATLPKRDAARSADKARQQLINAGSL
ncbi:uncharacterized protein LOC135827185 [Sycon ciliatum]|uniref:uncharacterized protein LOC135827185 n=1 Tax=Sycon ciliatum TaxID=27933 RepID=UPI0031F61CC3